MLVKTPLYYPDPLRNAITNAYRMDESEALNVLIEAASLDQTILGNIKLLADQWVTKTRAYQQKQSGIESLLHQYDLSTDEGIALMCLAEALLRIPDTDTMDKFISDKLSPVAWKSQINKTNLLFINATAWSLFLTGKIFSPTLNREQSLLNTLKKTFSRLGISVLRPILLKLMKILGNQFVIGETIEDALKRALTLEGKNYLFSYDMLGEAARSADDASHYFKLYFHAIETIGEIAAKKKSPQKNPGISIKLSALHPRYEITQYERVLKEVPPLLFQLALQAKKYDMNLTIDAEESDRLDMSLDIFEKVYMDPALDHWEGLGLAVQAYQKRAFYVIDWVYELAKKNNKKIMLRLVKGAYWDAEIKWAQIQGLENYPVFTRKPATDVSYLACARKLLSLNQYIFPQFGTHNAYTIAAILEMAGSSTDFEFQCLYGMGKPIYQHYVEDQPKVPVRIYAPVGSYRDLLGYLVRRLLENGANSSFINMLSKREISLDKINRDPVAFIKAVDCTPHPKIPLPKDIYPQWQNSFGLDLSNQDVLQTLKDKMSVFAKEKKYAASLLDGEMTKTNSQLHFSPNKDKALLGEIYPANQTVVENALENAMLGFNSWRQTTVDERTSILEKAGELLQENMAQFITLLVQEGGRTILDSMAEVREAIDYCKYYAYRARKDLKKITLPGPTGEENEMQLYPRGVIVCISPWNFPLAIFLGQITAALVTGNTVIAKPAEQTPMIAFKAVQLLFQAGIPKYALQLLIGDGKIGALLTKDERIAGVVFTGSTETAKLIEISLAHRSGPIGFLLAETGGLNTMIMDSSALIEQSVIDIVQSAFNSAGQRCSALRVLLIQEEIADRFLHLLKGYVEELSVNDPLWLSTDVGPVIDKEAHDKLKKHLEKMKQNEAKVIAKASLKNTDENYFAPHVLEIKDLSLLTEEVFGPILHVIKYKSNELEKVLESIINTRYGLTLGIQSRINASCYYIANKMPIGNIYVNRNMIGAVVGVQPFGGENLSGTGPKAGGPHYLPRFCVERARSKNIAAFGGNAQLISLLDEED